MDLLESFISSLPSSDAAASIVSDYFEWQTQLRGADFIPSTDDDVDLRTYLFYLLTNGADRVTLDEQTSALRQFYGWAKTKRVITDNPFDEYNFAQPSLASAKIDPRLRTVPNNLNDREMERLHALSQISEQLNSSVDIQSALDSTLRTLLKVMNLQTGWVSMFTDPHLSVLPMEDSPPHGFVLATARGLPRGFERN